MTKVGIITNPRSHRNKDGLTPLKDAIAGKADVHHVILDDVSHIPDILHDFARREIGLLAVVGGDGTIQATLTGLFSDGPFEIQPVLAVLPGGRTNMIAADVGVRARRNQEIPRLLSLAAQGNLSNSIAERRIVRIDHVRDSGTQFGMFFGAAGICRAIQSCRRKYHTQGVHTDIASALTLAGSVFRLLSGRGGEDDICRADDIAITFDNEETTCRPCLSVLATTLDRLLLKTRPFWSERPGPLHFAYITYPPKRLGLYVPRLLYGGPRRKLPAESYFSRDATSVRLKLDHPFTLDGEFFEADPDGEIVLSSDNRAHFVR